MRSKTMITAAAALTWAVWADSAAAQRADAGPALAAVMTYRASFLGDTPRLDACTVIREVGAGALAPIDPSLVEGAADGCPRTRTPGGSAVLLDSLSVQDGAMHVHVTVARGEYVHREDYTVRRWESGEFRGVEQVRIWGAVQSRPVPSGRAGGR